MSRLELRDIRKSVSMPDGRRLEILRGVDLSVSQGESVAIVGRSGSGKTTLLSIAGLLTGPEHGAVLLDGRPVTHLREAARAARRNDSIGFVFQAYSLVPSLTVAENLAVPFEYGSFVPRRRRVERVRELLAELGLEGKADLRPRRLSGGEQQRVAIGRALVRRPKLILADEPTGALDIDTGESVIRLLLDSAARWRAALLLVTHDPEIAAAAGRTLQMGDGRLMSGEGARHIGAST